MVLTQKKIKRERERKGMVNGIKEKFMSTRSTEKWIEKETNQNRGGTRMGRERKKGHEDSKKREQKHCIGEVRRRPH